MQLQHLTDVVANLNEIFKNMQFVPAYDRLVASLNQARSNPSANSSQEVKKAREDVIIELRKSIPKSWNLFTTRVFEKLGANSVLGEGGIQALEKIFVDFPADPHGAAQAVEALKQKTYQLQLRVQQFANVFGPLIDDMMPEAIPDGFSVVQLIFEQDASVRTVEELQQAAKDWHFILTGFARITGETFKSIPIRSIEQGSLLLELMATRAIVKLVTSSINDILSVIERTLQIRKTIAEVKKLELPDNSAVKNLEENLAAIVEKAADSAAEKAIKSLDAASTAKKKAIDGEEKTQLKMSIKKMYLFISNGGKIDTLETEEDAEDNSELQSKISSRLSKMRELENAIKALEAPPIDNRVLGISDEDFPDDKDKKNKGQKK